jgi:hypothetical protein
MRGLTPKSQRVPQVAVLSHHQPAGSKTGTFLPREVAEQLVQRMAAERISSKVIRMMSPSSVFLPAVQSVAPGTTRYVPTKLSSGEIGNCRFFPPRDPNWNTVHRQAMHSLRVRASMALKAFRKMTQQQAASA